MTQSGKSREREQKERKTEKSPPALCTILNAEPQFRWHPSSVDR